MKGDYEHSDSIQTENNVIEILAHTPSQQDDGVHLQHALHERKHLAVVDVEKRASNNNTQPACPQRDAHRLFVGTLHR